MWSCLFRTRAPNFPETFSRQATDSSLSQATDPSISRQTTNSSLSHQATDSSLGSWCDLSQDNGSFSSMYATEPGQNCGFVNDNGYAQGSMDNTNENHNAKPPTSCSPDFPSPDPTEPPLSLSPRTRKRTSNSVSAQGKSRRCSVRDCNTYIKRCSDLKRHEKGHEPAQYYCRYPGCNRGPFKRKDGLQRHERTHKGERGRTNC